MLFEVFVHFSNVEDEREVLSIGPHAIIAYLNIHCAFLAQTQ